MYLHNNTITIFPGERCLLKVQKTRLPKRKVQFSTLTVGLLYKVAKLSMTSLSGVKWELCRLPVFIKY